jgi:flagellar motor switch protein FliN/FliY
MAPEASRPNEPAGGGNAGGNDASKLLSQGDIEALLQGASAATRPAATATAPAPTLSEPSVPREDIELLLRQAEAAIASVDAPRDAAAKTAPFRLEELGGARPSTEMATFQLLRDVELDLKIELGRTLMQLEDVLKLRRGSVVTLDKLAGDPVDIYVNGRLIARGEVLVLNDNFCVRVAELIAATPST